MCNAKSMRRARDEVVYFVQQLGFHLSGPLPEIAPRYRIGPRQMHAIVRKAADETVTLTPALWDLIPPASKERPRYLLTNARADKIAAAWPWQLIHRKGRCLVPSDGFFEPAKPARAKGSAPWWYYALKDGGLFMMAGLCSEAADTQTGEIVTSYAVVTTEANSAIEVHDRMPVMLSPGDAAAWLSGEKLPAHLLRPYPAEAMTGWRVSDEAKNFRKADHAGMIAPLTTQGTLL